MKIGHLILDEKFTDFAIESFTRRTQLDNVFYILKLGDDDFLHIKSKFPIERVSEEAILNKTFLKAINSCDFIFLHGLTSFGINIVLHSAPQKGFVWFAWGGDFYNVHPALVSRLLLPQTVKLVYGNLGKHFIRRCVATLINFFPFLRPSFDKQLQAIRKINFIAPVIYDDYLLIANTYNLNSKCQPLGFIYGNIQTFIPQEIKVAGRSVLLGNSATPSNNHLDAFLKIHHLSEEFDNVVVPLSYGNKAYASKVVEKGKDLFGEKFNPLRDYVPIEKYFQILSNCEFVIMNHLRQQGMGNLYAFIYYGAKVYLQPSSTTYKFFRRLNIYVFSVHELENETRLTPLTVLQKNHNREVISSFLSVDRVEQLIDELLTKVNFNK